MRCGSRPRGLLTLMLGCALLPDCAHSRPQEADRGSSSTMAAAAPVGAALDAHMHGWRVGQWYSYPLTLATTVSFGENVRALDFELTGLLQVTPSARTDEAATLYVAIARPRIVSRVPESQSELDKVSDQLAKTGCFFDLAGGHVVGMRTPHGLSPTAANTYREIGAALQFSRTVQPADVYTAEEYDTTGRYVAEYRLDPSEQVWRRRKLRYIAILGAPKSSAPAIPAQVVPEIDRSESRIRLHADDSLESLESTDVVTVAGAQQPVRSTTSLSLGAVREDSAQGTTPDWQTLMEGMHRIDANEPYGGAVATLESLDNARIAGMTFEQAVTGLERLASQKSHRPTSAVNGGRMLDPEEQASQERMTAEESRLFIALSAIFREQPKTIAQAARRIQSKSPASDLLIQALSSASSPATQTALVQLATAKEVDPLTRSRVLLSLSRTPRPSQKSIDLLKGIASSSPFNEEALLGLGTYSRRLRDAGSPDQAAVLGDFLVEQLKRATKTTDRLAVLRAITNSGYAAALPHVMSYVTNGAEDLRVAAVRALQSMNDPKIDDTLAERLQSDDSNDVRISALRAAKVREPTDALSRAVEYSATSAADPHVRYRAVEVLAAWVSRRPELRGTLEEVAKNDEASRIRDRAQGAL